jgi:DNA-binding MarR family transcriptional regulator
MGTARATLDRALQHTPADPLACIFRSVNRLARVVTGAYDHAFAPHGLTAGQFNLLMTLARSGPLSVGALAGHLSADPSTIPRLLAPLLGARLAARVPGRDRRVRMIAVTEKGCARLQAALPCWYALQSELTRRLPDPGWNGLRASLRSLRREAQYCASRAAQRARENT